MTSQGQEKITKEPTNTQTLLTKHFHTQHKANNLKNQTKAFIHDNNIINLIKKQLLNIQKPHYHVKSSFSK